MSKIFGGSKSKQGSSSTNQAYPYLQGALSGTIGQGAQAGSALADMLGLNGTPAQTAGFDRWRNSTGYKFGMDQGTNAITGNAAARGLLGSGSTLKALNTFGQEYANSQYGKYADMLSNLLGAGTANAGVLAGAGNTSQSWGKSNESKGVGGFIGSILGKGK